MDARIAVDLRRWLIIYGVVVLVLGLAGVFYDAEMGFGFNAAAISGVIAGGAAAVLSWLWALGLGMKGRWAYWGALVTTSLFLLAFAGRGAMGWSAMLGGEPGKGVAVTLITLMTLATLGLLVCILMRLGLMRQAEAQTQADEDA